MRAWLKAGAGAAALAAIPLHGARAQVACGVSGPSFAFGQLNVASPSPTYSSGSSQVTCSNGYGFAITAYACVTFGTGTGGMSGSDRAMSSGPSRIPLEIRESAGNGPQVGDGTTWQGSSVKTLSLPANGSASVTFPFVASVPGGLSPLPPAGSYLSTFAGADYALLGSVTPSSTCAQVKASLAQSVSGSMSVTATVVNQCSVSAAPLNFGAASLMASNIDASSVVTVTCNASTPATLGLDNGSHGGTGPTDRRMTAGASTVRYGIYWDAARTAPAGTVGAGGQPLSVPGTAAQTVFGRVPPQASVPPGTYTDVVGVTVSY